MVVQSVILALSQIWAHKMRAALTTLGILIGVASVTAVIAGLSGLRAKVEGNFEVLGTKRMWAYGRYPRRGPKRNWPWSKITLRASELVGLLEHCPSIAAFSRSSHRELSVRSSSEMVEQVRIIGIDPSWHEISNRSVVLGRTFSHMDQREGRQVCLITEKLRDKLLLDEKCVGERLIVGRRSFAVVGIVEPPLQLESFGMGQGDERFEMYVPFDSNTYGGRDWVGVVEAIAKSSELSEEAKAELTFFLRKRRKVGPGEEDTFKVETLQGMFDVFNKIAAAVTGVTSGIVGISLLVGGIGIMNIMLVSVSERTREIGLRKAVGAKPSAICAQFLIEAVVLCFIGGAMGVGLGWLLTFAMKQIPGLRLDKAYIPGWAILLSFSFSTAVGLVFGMFPAIKAARLDPIKALRHE